MSQLLCTSFLHPRHITTLLNTTQQSLQDRLKAAQNRYHLQIDDTSLPYTLPQVSTQIRLIPATIPTMTMSDTTTTNAGTTGTTTTAEPPSPTTIWLMLGACLVVACSLVNMQIMLFQPRPELKGWMAWLWYYAQFASVFVLFIGVFIWIKKTHNEVFGGV